uniref:MADF domain-containing protein n=1 Tax=Caenorhabditis tropicalis TaxID=1561998 RepID=A0A1I7UM35_9PELO
METLIYLSEQRQKWINEDQKLILTILQEYEQSGGGLLPENDPAPMKRKSRKPLEMPQESPEIFVFTCQLLDLVKEEPPIWDKINCPKFGYHQPMRQSWCSVSLKLGGWGAMQHVHMLKQLYRRRRDQYNIDHLRHGRPFIYSEKLSFIKNILEKTKSDQLNMDIRLEDHLAASEPKIDYESEITGAPEQIQHILNSVSSIIDVASNVLPPKIFAHYLSKCCNDMVEHRETLATAGLHDSEWIDSLISVEKKELEAKIEEEEEIDSTQGNFQFS